MKTRGARLLLSVAVFHVLLSSALLFCVQPMAAKALIGSLGGSPMVWTVSMLCFQVFLLAGYFATERFVFGGPVWRRFAYPALAVVGLGSLFTQFRAWDGTGTPTLFLMSELLLVIAAPFVFLSTGSPLAQDAVSRLPARFAENPYPLYAAGNVGSLGGLLAYPFVIERQWSLAEQLSYWRWAWAATVVTGLFLFTISRWQTGRIHGAASTAESDEPPERSSTVAWRDLFRWGLLAFMPSSLLLGVTTYATNEVAAVPLLWVVPMACFLGSYVLAFSFKGPRVAVLRTGSLLVTAALILLTLTSPTAPVVLAHFVGFLFLAYLFHAQLYRLRPPPRDLTRFYLALAVGGALGGVFNGVVAPMIFHGSYEYVFVLVLALLVPRVVATMGAGNANWRGVAWLTVPVMGLLFVLTLNDKQPGILFAERSFFGTHTVVDRDGYRQLIHGATMHGGQILDPSREFEGSTYYAPEGPVAEVMRSVPSGAHIAVAGLGAGAITVHRPEGAHIDVFEIDPVVEKVARDPNLFTYLQHCGSECEVHIGDARLAIAKQPKNRYSLIILDAFSSDSVPVHLLTTDAMRVYMERVVDDGTIMFNVSNRYMNLVPVLAATIETVGWKAYTRYDDATTRSEFGTPSQWVVAKKSDATAKSMLTHPDWTPAERAGAQAWTDEYSNIVDAIVWPF